MSADNSEPTVEELAERIEQLESTQQKLKQGAVDNQGRTWTLSKLLSYGLTRRQALAALGAIAGGAALPVAFTRAVQAAPGDDGDTVWGSDANRDDYYADEIDANSVSTDQTLSESLPTVRVYVDSDSGEYVADHGSELARGTDTGQVINNAIADIKESRDGSGDEYLAEFKFSDDIFEYSTEISVDGNEYGLKLSGEGRQSTEFRAVSSGITIVDMDSDGTAFNGYHTINGIHLNGNNNASHAVRGKTYQSHIYDCLITDCNSAGVRWDSATHTTGENTIENSVIKRCPPNYRNNDNDCQLDNVVLSESSTRGIYDTNNGLQASNIHVWGNGQNVVHEGASQPRIGGPSFIEDAGEDNVRIIDTPRVQYKSVYFWKRAQNTSGGRHINAFGATSGSKDSHFAACTFDDSGNSETSAPIAMFGATVNVDFDAIKLLNVSSSSDFDVPNDTKINGEIVAAGTSETPSSTDRGPCFIDYTDTDDGSGTGVYYESRNGVISGPL